MAIAILLSAFLFPPVIAAQNQVDQLQLQQLNRASDATLRRIQQSPIDPSTPARDTKSQRNIDRRQRAELQSLQNRQQRDLQMLNRRAKTRPTTGPSSSLRRLERQGQFQRQQQRQLNRFRLER